MHQLFEQHTNNTWAEKINTLRHGATTAILLGYVIGDKLWKTGFHKHIQEARSDHEKGREKRRGKNERFIDFRVME